MPGELTPSEYRERVRSSQRRVEQWIIETSRHMPFAVYDPPEVPTEQDSSEAGPLENAQRSGSSARGGSSSKELSHSLRKEAFVNRAHEDDNVRHELDHRSRRSSSPHRRSTRDVDQDPSAHSHSRTRPASSTKKSSSRNGQTSRGAPTATTGKPSIGSSKDKDRHRSSRHSHSTGHRKRARDTYDRPTSRSKSTAIDIISLLPYGILPLLFAMMGGSSVISFAAAGLMLAGYFAIDYTVRNSAFTSMYYRVSQGLKTDSETVVTKVEKIMTTSEVAS